MPSVSFIIPSHNRASELPQTLDALLAQTRRDWEAILIDDHSTDGALEVARASAERDARIKVIQLPDPYRGASIGRNHALPHASGEFVIFLDSDDLVTPTCVEQRVAYMEAHPDLDFAVWRCQLFRKTPGDVPLLFNTDTGADDLDRYLTSDVPWQTMQPIWRRASLARLTLPRRAEAGPIQPTAELPQIWDESVLSGQDWEFHIRALALGLRYARVDTVDCHWRMAGPDRDSIGKQSFSKQHARARPSVVRKMYDFLQSHGQLTPRRKQAFAALWFLASDTLAKRVSRKEGRIVWRDALSLGLVNKRQWRQADRYLFLQRWPSLAAKMRRRIDREWPREMLPQRGKFFCLTPLPGRSPRVSVVMSAYNNAAYVREAVESILDQSYLDFELIIIDDGSTDETGAILRNFADRDCRVRLVQRENRGLTVSLNEGLSLARGEYIARMDADDVALRDRLAEQVAYLDANPGVVLLGTKVMLIDPCGVELVEGEFHTGHDRIDAALLRGNGSALYHPATMMRRSAIDRVGVYDPAYNGAEDIELFLRLAEVGRVENLDRILLQYRKHPSSVNHTKHAQQRVLVLDLLRKARVRRGLPDIPPSEVRAWSAEPIASLLRNWAWNALRRRNVRVARNHALGAVRRDPLKLENWRVLACAWRGH